MATLRFYRVDELPASPVANAIYFVDLGSTSAMYVIDSSGTTHRVVDRDLADHTGTLEDANVTIDGGLL